MINDDLYVLHLSDLHIKNEASSKSGVVLSNALKKLIADIDKQTKHHEKLILVISGDTMDAGFYNDSRNTDAALRFFTKLHEKIGTKVGADIIIVPGNHDKKRSAINTLISKKHAESGLSLSENNSFDGDSNGWWEEHQKAYADFLNLASQIYDIFGKPALSNTFGVDVIKHGDSTVCFLRLDTSWCSCTSDDQRRLRIGKYQLSELFSEYREIKDGCDEAECPIHLTVAVSHHPLNWMTPDDEDECSKYFLSSDLLDVDLLMCGHIHESDIFNYFNNEHSLITLVTGIGRSDLPEQHRTSSYRYALYTINLFRNSCDISMWKSEGGGDFKPDYSIYGVRNEQNKLQYPLKIKENSAFIKLNALGFESKNLFIDNELLELLPKVVDSISLFSNNVGMLYENYLDEFFYIIVEKEVPNFFLFSDDDDDNDKEQKLSDCEKAKIKEIELWLSAQLREDEPPRNAKFQKYFQTTDAFGIFKTFLQDVCVEATEHLSKCFSEGVKLRFHFRYHSTENKRDVYLKCARSDNLCQKDRTGKMQDIDWDEKKSMITLAQNVGPVVFSSNKERNKALTDWDDFITFIPKFDRYLYTAKRNGKKLGDRPIFSAGISIKDTNTRQDNLVLYVLGYLGIDKIVANFIDDYINFFEIDVGKIPAQMNELMNINEEGSQE